MIAEIGAVVLMSVFDRARGNPNRGFPKAMALAVLGLAAASLLHIVNPVDYVFIALAIAVGYSVGWGHPLGTALKGRPNTAYEWWQVTQPLRQYPYLALSARGAMIGLLVALSGNFHSALIVGVACAVAFPSAPAITVYGLRQVHDRGWATQEYIRGGLVGVLMVVLPGIFV